MSCFRFLALLAGCSLAGGAAEFEVSFQALERHLAKQVFTQEGRKYFAGANPKDCNFAAMENPRFSQQGDLLRIQTKFSGRRAWNLMGFCVGLGDAFDLTIDARPAYRNGSIFLDQVKVEPSVKDGIYARRAKQEIQRTLTRDFKYPLLDETRRIMAEQRGKIDFALDMPKFEVKSIVISSGSLVFDLDFRLTLK